MSGAAVEMATGQGDVAELFAARLDGAAVRTVLCDGAMGTMLYGGGVFINRSYDELNVTQPEMVRAVHLEYLQAGAEMIETNTFGANRLRLERYGLGEKVRELNLAGVRLARRCVEELREKQASQAFVAGAIGSLGVSVGVEVGGLNADGMACGARKPVGMVLAEAAREVFAEQVKALVEGGVDLIVVETMMSMGEVEQAINAVKDEGKGLKVIVMVTVDEDGRCLDGTSAEDAARANRGLGSRCGWV